MLTFKTQFPINNNKTIDDLLESGRIWLAGSPHSLIAEKLANAKDIKDDWTTSSDHESIVFARHEGDLCVSAFRYENTDADSVRWITEVIGVRFPNKFLVSVQLDVGSELPVEKIDYGKRPHILKTIMREIGGGKDGQLLVSDKPIYLSEEQVDVAADLINSNSGSLMPIVYVSADDDNESHVNPIQLAQWLSGMAHVIVEPSRDFSFELMPNVSGENAYGGAVAIYWPDGIGKWLFMPTYEYRNSKKMQIDIARKVRQSLLSQRTKKECTWSHVQELKSKARINDLKKSGDVQIDDYINAFDDELSSKNEEISRLQQEINRLKYSGTTAAQDNTSQEQGLILSSTEKDLYQGEKAEIVIDTITSAVNATQQHSRRRHILEDFRDNNLQTGERDSILDTLKELLRSYKQMSPALKKELERLGFSVTEEGKHYKLEFRNDKRYHFTLAKTGSDHRGGLNAFSEIKKQLF